MTEKIQKPSVKIKSRIITKSVIGVICIFLPVFLLFEYVSHFGKATQERIEIERKNLEFSARINRTASSVALASGYLVIHLLMNSQKASQGWERHREAASDEVHELENFSKTIESSEKNFLVSKLVSHTYNAINTWSRLRPVGSTGEIRDVVSNMKSMRWYFLNLFKLHMRFQKIEFDEQARLSRGIEQAKLELESINQVLNVASLALFLGTTYLVARFSREITERLKIVVENAQRLPLREKLNQPVSGSDEIAYLDYVLHEAHDRLEHSAQFRKSLLEMVAHDMCSPLAAVNLSLAILQKEQEPAGQVSKSAIESFEKAALCIEKLVTKANSLLSIERLCANSPELAIADADAAAFSQDGNINELSRLLRIEFRSRSGLGSEAAARFRPGIFKKGLLLFLLPLAFSTVMIFSLSMLNQKEAQLLDVELRQSEIAVTINRLMVSMVAHMAVVGNYQWYGDSQNRDLEEPVARLFPITAKKLLELVGSDRKTVADVNELLELDRKERTLLAKEKPVAVPVEALPTPAFAAPGRAIVIYSIRKMEKIQQLTDRQFEKLSEIRKSAEEVRKQKDLCLQVGIFASVILVFLQLLAFDNDISRRLKVLAANAELLPMRKPLHENVGGSDEIWYLDFVLHDVAEILEATWQQRMLMMEVLADDLRKPLNEARESLSGVPTSETENYSDLRKRHYKFATANVDRVLSLVEALLTIENLEQGKIELVKSSFCAREIAQTAIGSLSALAQNRNVSLANDCRDVEVFADRERVVQVLVNYLGNAINHSPANTTVRIDTSQTPHGVRFDVIDNGPGLNSQMRSKVFERFFQTEDSKTKGKGYGLGLAICRMIVEAHDGSVGCDQAPTGGCSFYAVFPHSNSKLSQSGT